MDRRTFIDYTSKEIMASPRDAKRKNSRTNSKKVRKATVKILKESVGSSF